MGILGWSHISIYNKSSRINNNRAAARRSHVKRSIAVTKIPWSEKVRSFIRDDAATNKLTCVKRVLLNLVEGRRKRRRDSSYLSSIADWFQSRGVMFFRCGIGK